MTTILEENETLIVLRVSPVKSFLGSALLVTLGFTLLYSIHKKTAEENIILDLIFLSVALTLIYYGWRIIKAKQTGVKLTKLGIYDLNNTLLYRTSDIKYLDRGIFAIKPANGFIIHLNKPLAFHWHPGLFWCIRKRLAIGGLLSKQECKAFADLLEIECGVKRI